MTDEDVTIEVKETVTKLNQELTEELVDKAVTIPLPSLSLDEELSDHTNGSAKPSHIIAHDSPDSSQEYTRPIDIPQPNPVAVPTVTRTLQPLEFPSIHDPKRTILCNSEEGGNFKRILTMEGVYYFIMENKGTGGMMSAKSFLTYQYRPLIWEAGGVELMQLIASQLQSKQYRRVLGPQLIRKSTDSTQSPNSPVTNHSDKQRDGNTGTDTERDDTTDSSAEVESVDREIPRGLCYIEVLKEEECYTPEFPVEGMSFEQPQNLPKVINGIACYQNTPIGMRFMHGKFGAARGATKIFYFYVGEPFQRLFCSLNFSWGKATNVKVTLGYGGKFLPIQPQISRPLAPVTYSRPPRNKLRILSLDGGGVLGGSILVILEYIEKELRRKTRNPDAQLLDHFDFVVGTSTGGMISAALLRGFKVRELREKWKSWAQTIFGGSRTALGALLFSEGYDVEPTKKLLQDVLGHEPLSCPRKNSPMCCITSTDVSHQPYQLYLHRNYDTRSTSHSSDCGPKYPGRVRNEASMLPLWLVAWIAGSAPTYIKGPNSVELSKMGIPVRQGERVHLVDGAFLANNPAIVALKEGAVFMGKSLNSFCSENVACLVSIGTGVVHKKKTESKDGNLSSLQILLNAPHLLLEASSVHKEIMHDILADKGDECYFRFNTPGLGDTQIDDAHEENMQFVTDASKQYMEEEKYYDTRRLVERLIASDT